MSEYKVGDYVWINDVKHIFMKIVSEKDKHGQWDTEFRHNNDNPIHKYKGKLHLTRIKSKATRLEEVLFGWS